MSLIHTAISTEHLSLHNAFEFIRCDAHGAESSFIGRVRNLNLGKEVTGVSYDVFTPFAIKTFQKICDQVHKNWGEELKIFIEHFHGRLNIGGISIIIAVSSPHRDESFQACRYIIESIKKQASIWKQEHYIDGNSEWVQGHALCQHAQIHPFL